MKRRTLAGSILAAVAAFQIATPAFAAFSIADLQVAAKEATDAFAAANPDHVQHFVGYKAWLSGQDSKVKIYVNHEGMAMEYNYVCHKHGAEIECHFQQ